MGAGEMSLSKTRQRPCPLDLCIGPQGSLFEEETFERKGKTLREPGRRIAGAKAGRWRPGTERRPVDLKPSRRYLTLSGNIYQVPKLLAYSWAEESWGTGRGTADRCREGFHILLPFALFSCA